MDASKRDKTDNVDSVKAIIKIQEQEKNNNQMTTQDCTVKIIFQTLRIRILQELWDTVFGF